MLAIIHFLGENPMPEAKKCKVYTPPPLVKLASAAQVRLPERRITEMIRAGLLHPAQLLSCL